MSPRRSVEDKLTELETAVSQADGDALIDAIGGGLDDRNHRVVALAAHYAGDRLCYECVPRLLSAYPRFLDNPVKRDPNCLAKKAVVRALHALDCDDIDFYLEAIRYRQLEPVWGGTVDTASDIRSSAAMGLVSSGYPRALVEVVELLTDDEPPVRLGAVRAIACGNPREAEQLLRAKVLAGDEEAEVIAECFAGLLSVEPDESPAFVARFLEDDDDDVREVAALALGESRLPEGLAALRKAWDDVLVASWFQRVLIRSAALHRSDEAFDWLLRLVVSSDATLATEVVDVLSIYRHNDALGARLAAALAERSDSGPAERFEQNWG